MTNTLNKIMHNGDEYVFPWQHITTTVTLESANWSNSEQTVTVNGVTADNTVLVSPDPSDYSDYTDAEIYCSGQGTNSLTFTCGTTPSNDIDVNVVILDS